MKKKFLFAIFLLVILVTVLCSCGGNDLTPGDSTVLYNPQGMKIEKGLDAYDLFKKAYETYQNSTEYQMEIDFTFNGNADTMGGIKLYQNTYQKIIRNGKLYYEYYIIGGEGMSVPTGDGDEFYYNYSNGDAKAKYVRKNKPVKVKLDKNKKVTADFSKVKWGVFNADKETIVNVKTAVEKADRLKTDFHQYNWLNDKNISSKTDRNVYKKNGKFYCTILIDTKTGDMRKEQEAVVKAIEKATGGNYSKFIEDTRMVAEIEKVDKTYRFTQFILMEDYAGEKEAIGKTTITASQQYWHKFYYDTDSIKIDV